MPFYSVLALGLDRMFGSNAAGESLQQNPLLSSPTGTQVREQRVKRQKSSQMKKERIDNEHASIQLFSRVFVFILKKENQDRQTRQRIALVA